METIKEIKIKWIFRLRWIAIFLIVLVIPFAIKYHYLHQEDLFKFIFVIFGLVLINLKFFSKFLNKFYQSISAQTIIDITAFTLLILLSGKMENPFWPLIYLHASMGAFLIEPKKDFHFLPFLFGSIAVVHGLSLQYYSSIIFIIIPQWIILIAIWFLTRNIGLLVLRQQQTISRLNEKELITKKIKTLNLLSSGILHEIGTPLNSIRLKTNRAIQKGKEAITDRDIEIMDTSLNSIENVISELNKLQFDNSVSVLEVFDLNEFLNNFVQAKNKQNNNLKLEFTTANKALVNISKLSLNLVLNVIYNNSIEADATTLSLKLEEIDQYFKIIIIDNGPGFSSFILENYMAPYTSTKGSGRGIGLFNANLSLESFGGFLSISNENGAKLVITLEKYE